MRINLVAISERLYHNPYGIDYKSGDGAESITDVEYITTVEAGDVYKVSVVRHDSNLNMRSKTIRYVVIPKQQ